MTKNLVIVESPAKARTIERYLGPDFKVLASYGHVRDLPENPGKGKFGVDVEHDFEPEYVVNEDRRKQLNAITKAAGGSDLVYLATDLDREGEAIAWHVVEAVKIPGDKTKRVTFSEITKSAITAAFEDPRDIDMGLVDAQQTRRIMDRLVGYTLSPLISRKVRSGLSAGRVQSVAVRIVVERERAIEAFKAREYWTIEADVSKQEQPFVARLVRYKGEKVEQFSFENEDQARDVEKTLLKAADAQPGWERIQATKNCLVLAEQLAEAAAVTSNSRHARICLANMDTDSTVVEYTGGSTGVSLAFVCAAKSIPLRIVTSGAFSSR